MAQSFNPADSARGILSVGISSLVRMLLPMSVSKGFNFSSSLKL
jgi:hypothetical protein